MIYKKIIVVIGFLISLSFSQNADFRWESVMSNLSGWESGWNPRFVNTNSWDYGLFQISRGTLLDYNIKNFWLTKRWYTTQDLLNPIINKTIALNHLEWLEGIFREDDRMPLLVLTSYEMGHTKGKKNWVDTNYCTVMLGKYWVDYIMTHTTNKNTLIISQGKLSPWIPQP